MNRHFQCLAAVFLVSIGRLLAAGREVSLAALALMAEDEFRDTSKGKKALEEIVEAFEQNFHPGESFDQSYARAFLGCIDDSVLGLGHEYPLDGGINRTFGEQLEDRRPNCYGRLLIYDEIAWRRREPLHIMSIPSHGFVMYRGEDWSVMWETTWGRELSRSDYISEFRIDRQSLSRGIYLLPLSDTEVMSLVYVSLARFLSRRGDFDKAIQLLSLSLVLKTDCIPALYDRGNLKMRLMAYDDAARDFEEIIRLDPSSTAAHDCRGLVYEQRGRVIDAIGCFGRALLIDRRDALARRKVKSLSARLVKRYMPVFGSRARASESAQALTYADSGVMLLQ